MPVEEPSGSTSGGGGGGDEDGRGSSNKTAVDPEAHSPETTTAWAAPVTAPTAAGAIGSPAVGGMEDGGDDAAAAEGSPGGGEEACEGGAGVEGSVAAGQEAARGKRATRVGDNSDNQGAEGGNEEEGKEEVKHGKCGAWETRKVGRRWSVGRKRRRKRGGGGGGCGGGGIGSGE